MGYAAMAVGSQPERRVLTENGIAEEGTHKELLAKGGIYAHLYEMQF